MTNTEHGHVYPRPDGLRMRCGGPGMCSECSKDLARSSINPIAKTIPELKADVARLKVELETAERHLCFARQDATGITVDDIVRGTGRFAGIEFKVTLIDVRFEGRPWLRGVKRRAGGSWGVGERHLFDNWEKIAS